MQKNQPVLFSTWGYDYTTPESEKGKTGNQAGNQTENQTENSNTSGGEPFEKEQLLTYQQGDHEMRFRLPKDWKYEILSQSGDFYEYGIRFHLADVEKNMTFYCYSNRFGVCGTGLETKMILLESGMEAEIGYYDGSEDWSYVSFFNIDVKLAAINNGITGAEAKNENPTKLNSLKKLDESSESNEYYHVECENENHFEVETVNRSAIENEIEGQKHEVYVSAFPFELNVYDNIDDFNKVAGFGKPVQVANTELKVSGYSERFVATGSAFGKQEASSFIIGTVKTFREVNAIIGEEEVDFIIVQLDTAIGTIPVAVSREVFDLEKLYAGKIIVMFADIKIDFIK